MHDNFATAITLLIQASVDGKPHHETVLEVGDTPQYLIDAGFPQRKVVIKGSTVDKAHFDHGITRSMLARLPDLLAKPKALYRSATHPDSAVIVSFEQKNGSPLLLPMHKDAMVGRALYNVVASAYCKEPTVEDRWAAKGLLLWKCNSPVK